MTDQASDQTRTDEGHDQKRRYLTFAAMILTSTVTMFLLTYTNSMQWSHMRWSDERVYMALLMGGAMTLIMFGFMRSMYENTRWNIVIVVTGVALAGIGLFLSRSQILVDDNDYMSGMIPHHSIAILTSERADIDDVRVRKLADDIIKAQREEIEEMEWLIADIEANGPAETEDEAAERPMPEFEGKLNPES